MKKILSAFLCVIVLLSLFTFSSYAANAHGEISADVCTAQKGGTVEVTISYKSNPGFWFLYLDVYFDTNAFDFVEAKGGDYTNLDIPAQTYPDIPGKIKLMGEGTEYNDVTGDGVLAKLVFKVKDTATVGTNYAIALNLGEGMACNFDVEYVTPDVKSGSVFVMCGDHTPSNGNCTTCGVAVDEGGAGIIDVSDLPETVAPEIPDSEGTTISQRADELDSENSKNAEKEKGKKQTFNIIIYVAIGLVAAAAVVCLVFVLKRKKKIQD